MWIWLQNGGFRLPAGVGSVVLVFIADFFGFIADFSEFIADFFMFIADFSEFIAPSE